MPSFRSSRVVAVPNVQPLIRHPCCLAVYPREVGLFDRTHLRTAAPTTLDASTKPGGETWIRAGALLLPAQLPNRLCAMVYSARPASGMHPISSARAGTWRDLRHLSACSSQRNSRRVESALFHLQMTRST